MAVGAERGANLHALLARNFEPRVVTQAAPSPALLVVRPAFGFGFVSVVWPGLPGVVSGINQHGLAIMVEPVATGEPG